MRQLATAFLALALVSACASAQVAPPEPYLTAGETIESQLAADFNGDGNPDIAYVAVKEGSRTLRVEFRYVGSDFVQTGVQELALDPYPLTDAQLTVTDSDKGAVLVFEEVTGGTTAVASTHRFRWDTQMDRMRLIGLDATLYSRTFAHDGREASWNLLTGDLVTLTLKLNAGAGDHAYDSVGETKTRKRSPPISLENSPSGDDLLSWPGAE
ncbi:hypothetical protein [Porphyrobacter sp. YT40]|uniref:hypothetical protein n=1 Tax=Porphyrobacter sp. YT40 TaxID=2547601 RepID=UPI001142CAC8|nr:hypothetical protein [Porphyrobacter sp. YT40]QDH33435.1 hypothetical protein E2E27_03225 [Porphyrobacter sp. YT40]